MRSHYAACRHGNAAESLPTTTFDSCLSDVNGADAREIPSANLFTRFSVAPFGNWFLQKIAELVLKIR